MRVIGDTGGIMPWDETNQWMPLDAIVRGSRRTGISQSVISRLEGGKLRGMR